MNEVELRERIKYLEQELKTAQKYADRYHLLESWGVDNWNGYDDAQKQWRKGEETGDYED